MKYNLMNRNDNEGILENIIEDNRGTLVITSDNSFIISTIVSELEELSKVKDFELFHAGVKVNEHSKSDNIVIALSSSDTLDKYPILNKTHRIARLERESKDSFSFNITFEIKEGIPTSDITLKSNNSTKLNDMTMDLDIISSIKSHNVVFLQDLNKNVIEDIKANRKDYKVFNNPEELSGDYTLSGKDGVLVLTFEAPKSNTVDHNDITSFISRALSYSLNIVCDLTWIKFFLELTTVEVEIDISSIVIYNTNNYGLQGNKELYNVN